MAGDHNVMADDGTVYAIEGGRAMDDGTVYEIESGNILADDGTVYAIEFTRPCIITITGSGLIDTYSYRCFISINGVTSYDSATTVEVEPGDMIYCYVYSSGQGSIIVDGTTVSSGQRKKLNYAYTVTSSANIELSISPSYKITITTL